MKKFKCKYLYIDGKDLIAIDTSNIKHIFKNCTLEDIGFSKGYKGSQIIQEPITITVPMEYYNNEI